MVDELPCLKDVSANLKQYRKKNHIGFGSSSILKFCVRQYFILLFKPKPKFAQID